MSLYFSLSLPISACPFLPFLSLRRQFRKSMLAHARSRERRSLRFVSLSYHYFLPAVINCLFSVDFSCFMRPTSAINVTDPVSFLHLPLSPHVSFHDHLSGIRDFRCQKHISSRLVINERLYHYGSLSCSSSETLFFCFRSNWQST